MEHIVGSSSPPFVGILCCPRLDIIGTGSGDRWPAVQIQKGAGWEYRILKVGS